MTDEQINKAAEEYADNECLDDFAESLVKEAFIKGANFANKHWQEKTRWIPVTESLPENRQEVLAKSINGRIYQASYEQYTEQDKENFIKRFTHWREIE